MKICTIVGTRPQFIKSAAVSRAIAEHNKRAADNLPPITEVIIHSGQHWAQNMSELFFREMRIPRPKFFLDINDLPHGAMTGQMLEKIETVLMTETPNLVFVYGDTNTTLAGALAAAKLNIPVAHVEAGLRSFNRRMPEEINRVLIDNISTFLFCPTNQAVKNLKSEGIGSNTKAQCFFIGDVMLDTAIYYKNYAREPQFDISGEFILATIHRAENTDNSEHLKSIFKSLKKISRAFPVVIPIHPRTKKMIQLLKLDVSCSGLTLVEPVGYLEMLYLLERTSLLITDSGGLQKEAYFFKKPCVTVREETEWVELVQLGFNILAGTDPTKIYNSFNSMLGREVHHKSNLYGEGKAGQKIVEIILNNQINEGEITL